MPGRARGLTVGLCRWWRRQVKTLLAFVLCPVAVALANRGEGGRKANMWAVFTLATLAYNLTVGGRELGRLNLWREEHVSEEYATSFRFDRWTTTIGWLALLALCGMLAPTMGRLPSGTGGRARCQCYSGNFAAV